MMNLDRTKIVSDVGYVKDHLKLSAHETSRLHRKHLNAILPWIVRFLGMQTEIAGSEGAYLIGKNGKRYVDFIAGFGALNFGFEPKEILQALRDVEGYPNLSHTFLNPLAGKLAETLTKITSPNLQRTFFCNSGAEAVEAAVKLARAATKKSVILYAERAFHGKTFGALSVSGREKYKKSFMPVVPGTRCVPFGDLEAFQRELKKGDVAAFIVEPIQGEGGIYEAPEGYLKSVRESLTKHHALMILDEIQTGMGRSGQLFYFHHDFFEPDVLVLSKSLSGGVIPLGAVMTKDRVWRAAYGTLEKCLLHTSTFGGNTRACAAGLAAVKLLLDQNLDQNAEKVGTNLIRRLRELQSQFRIIKEVRGRGLMIGVSFDHGLAKSSGLLEGSLTMLVARRLFLRHGIISGFTLNNYNILRIEPPLIIGQKEVDHFIAGLSDVLDGLQKDKALKLAQKLVGV